MKDDRFPASTKISAVLAAGCLLAMLSIDLYGARADRVDRLRLREIAVQSQVKIREFKDRRYHAGIGARADASIYVH